MAEHPGALRRSGRTIIHAAITTVLMNAVGPAIAHRPLGETLNNVAQPHAYVPFSVGLAAALNNDRVTAILLALILVIDSYPDHLLQSAAPALGGLVVGAAIRYIVTEEQPR